MKKILLKAYLEIFWWKKLKGGSDKVEIVSACNLDQLQKKSKIASLSVEPFMVKFEFEIYNCDFCSFLLFLQGEFQEKLNKFESESENEG